jgi:hypothetical protein
LGRAALGAIRLPLAPPPDRLGPAPVAMTGGTVAHAFILGSFVLVSSAESRFDQLLAEGP